MRRTLAIGVAALGCLLVPGTYVTATEDTSYADSLAYRERAVALVLGEDPRFAGLPDWETQTQLAASVFDNGLVFGTDYYRTLPTQAAQYPWMLDFGYPGSWLVEVNLVRGCGEFPQDRAPDPCDWRHTWLYRVEPDDTVMLLFEEGDPDLSPAE